MLSEKHKLMNYLEILKDRIDEDDSKIKERNQDYQNILKLKEILNSISGKEIFELILKLIPTDAGLTSTTEEHQNMMMANFKERIKTFEYIIQELKEKYLK